MHAPRTTVLCALPLFVVVGAHDAQAQTEPSRVTDNATAPTDLDEIEEIIVRGRDFGDLRFEIDRAEEAVFARFNDINSTDDFDILCRIEKQGHRQVRACQSNFGRELAGDAGKAAAQGMQGRGNIGLGQLYAQIARHKQQLLDAEMRQLATEDEQFREAIAELSQAQLALTLARGKTTLSRQVSAELGSLPYGAELMFEIIMGVKPFSHPLTQQTFTIADVLGEIRKLTVDCAEGRQQIDYEIGVDWTVPSGWSSCTLQVNAARETTFRLYEF